MADNPRTASWFLHSGKSGNGCPQYVRGTADFGSSRLSKFDERTQANIEVVLDEICSTLPNGGDHESRKFIAEHLVRAARSGNATLGELTYVGRRALVWLQNKSA